MLYICLSIFLFVVGCDQLTKVLFFERSVGFINGLIRFEYSPNYGMAWGMLSNVKGAAIILAVFSLLFVGVMVFILIKWRKLLSRLIMISLSLIIAGAVGNMIDRVVLGYVRDFIYTEFMRFPTFNIADSAVTVGGIMLAIAILFTKGGDRIVQALESKKGKKADSDTSPTEPETANTVDYADDGNTDIETMTDRETNTDITTITEHNDGAE